MGKVLDFTLSLSLLTNGDLPAKVGPAAQKLSQLGQQMQALQRQSANISGYQKQAQKLSELRTKLDTAQAKIRTMKETMRAGGHVDARLFTKAHEEAQRLLQQVQENSKRLGEFRAELRGAGVDTNNLASAQANLQRQTDAMTRAQERLSRAQNNYAALKDRLSWNNLKGDVAAILGTYTFLKAPVKLAADFESAMARVKAAAFSNEGSDMAGFEAMTQQAIQLGADTQFTAIQAAATQENLARSGMSSKDIIAAMPAVLNMASAEGMDLAQAGNIIAKSLGGMNLEGKFAARLADILAYTSANSNTNIAMLGEAFKVAAPVFASQGATMEQLASYLGVLANKGYEGSEAGSAIAAAPLRLAKQTTETKAALATLGVAVLTKDGRLRELPDIMKALNEAMIKRNYGEAKQLEVIETIFGKNYGKAMMGFLSASASGDADKMQAGVYNDSYGRAAKMTGINLDTLNGQLAILGSAWDGVKKTVGDMFSPIVRKGVETLAAALSSINAAMKEFPVAAESITLFISGLAGMKAAKSIYEIGSALVRLPGAWLEVQQAAKAATAAVGGVTAGIDGAAKAAGLFGTTLNMSLGTLALIAAACYEIYKHWDNIIAAAQRAGEAISKIDRSTPVGEISRGSGFHGKAGNYNYAIRQMESAYAMPEISNAKGGIYDRPIWTWAAEAGAEAIIPLTDKARGIPLLMKSAEILGVLPKDNGLPSMSMSHSLSEGIAVPSVSQAFSQSTNSNITQSLPSFSENISSSTSSSNFAVKELWQNVRNYFRPDFDGAESRGTLTSDLPRPQTITLNVNVQGATSEDASLAERIARAVREELAGVMSLNERVSFA